MNNISHEEAMMFLVKHQPMPSTKRRNDEVELCSDELMKQYQQVLKYFMENPDENAIPLFLNSFGGGDGHGVYQYVEEFLQKFPNKTVIKHLKKSLMSKSSDVLSWVAQFASGYINEDQEILCLLLYLLANKDCDVRIFSLYTIFLCHQIPKDAIRFIKECHSKEKDPDVLEIYEELLKTYEDSIMDGK